MAVRDTVRRKLTYEDYVLFPEDGQRHEILDGEHYVMPAPSFSHQGISFKLCLRIGSFVLEHRLGFVRYAPLDVLLSEYDIVQPDLLFISNERAGNVKEPNVHGAPDLVVEILSDSSRQRDEILKPHLYERSGVLEYWLVDPQARTVKVFRSSGTRFFAPREFSAALGDILTTPLLLGLEIPVHEIFE